jgi:hypothetical protein
MQSRLSMTCNRYDLHGGGGGELVCVYTVHPPLPLPRPISQLIQVVLNQRRLSFLSPGSSMKLNIRTRETFLL